MLTADALTVRLCRRDFGRNEAWLVSAAGRGGWAEIAEGIGIISVDGRPHESLSRDPKLDPNRKATMVENLTVRAQGADRQYEHGGKMRRVEGKR